MTNHETRLLLRTLWSGAPAVFVAIFAILPARFAYVSFRRAKRMRTGFCAQCGYYMSCADYY